MTSKNRGNIDIPKLFNVHNLNPVIIQPASCGKQTMVMKCDMFYSRNLFV